ncbi:MAG: phosphate acyltransferase PlsX [Acidobacteriota bacterium]
MSFKIAIDAMGGDFAPQNVVYGAVQAAREFNLNLILVGRRDDILMELSKHDTAGLNIEIDNASEVIGMEEQPTLALRQKKDSSIRVGARLVREGKAMGLVSAGHTGAVLAASKILIGVIPGVDRPALAAAVPNRRGTSIWIDVGANIDCKPLHLKQFAVMGHLYAREIMRIPNPRIGLLSIGEEDIKGNEKTKEVFKVLKEANLNFIGNVEGSAVFNGEVDVIVCDGFVGNISLKVAESVLETMVYLLKEEISKTYSRQFGYFFLRPTFREFKKRIDYAEYGGAPLLGTKGCVIICHGKSSAKAIRNALKVARDFIQNNVGERIYQEIKNLAEAEERIL